MYMFWGIAVGICLGARFWAVAAIGSLGIGLIMILLTSIKLKSALPYLLVLHYENDSSQQVRALLSKVPGHKLKSKTLRGTTVEMTVEMRLRNEEAAFVDKFMMIDGMYDASLISYQGDIIS